MLMLHQIKLMTSNGLYILLILLGKRIEGVNGAKLEKVFMNHRENSIMTDEIESIIGKN